MKKKIVFGITGLTLGGAERTLVDIVNRLCFKYDITIFCIYSNGELESQLLDKVKLIYLYNKNYNQMTKIEKIYMSLNIFINKKEIYKANIWGKFHKEIAFLEGPVTRIFASSGKKNKKIAWIHNDITKVFGKGLKANIKKLLNKRIYKKYGQLVFVSKDNMKKFNKKYKIKNKKQVIYNYIDSNQVIKKSNEKMDFEFPKYTINFVIVCRLVKQKALDRLIKVHSKLIKEGYKHNFFIVGTGYHRKKLEDMIKAEGVEDSFILLGKKVNPYPYIKNADFFCLLSYFEGYGNVLEEAKILNKNILITDTAAREAIENYEEGKIFENSADGIYIGLKDIISGKEIINGNRTQDKKYNNEKIIEQITELIES